MDINYPKRISLSNLIHMMSMGNLVAINMNTPRVDNDSSLEGNPITINMDAWTKDYMCTLSDDRKVPYRSSYKIQIS